MENVNFTAIDFETAYSQKHACQLGIVVVRKGEIIEEKEFLIQPPGNKISEYCRQIHGITPYMTKNAPTFGELWPDIKKYFQHQIIIHHSDGFDIRIINQELDFYNISHCRFISVESTMRLFDDRYSQSLANLCSAFGIQMEQHHDALSDARCCAEIFLRYLKGEEPDYNRLPKKKIANQYSSPDEEGLNIDITKPERHFSVLYDTNRIVQSETYVQDLSIVTNRDTVFYDKKVVISGVFERYPIRNDLALLLKGYGADINGSISSKTNIFVIGKDFGPKKMEKVFELNNGGYNIQIIEETQLYKLLEERNNGKERNG
jgi:DNA polymerase-3 subunit epsilon